MKTFAALHDTRTPLGDILSNWGPRIVRSLALIGLVAGKHNEGDFS